MALGKRMLLLAAYCGLAWGQTGFTTIQDTLFKADGTLFNGSLTIQWSTFDANNIGTIVQQSTTVPVVNGNLLVQLAPNNTAPPPTNIYTVLYQSDGREQFAETWTVPVSTVALKGRRSADRDSRGHGHRSSTGQRRLRRRSPNRASSILQADLAQRPLKGVGFGTNAVAIRGRQRADRDMRSGDPGDCVFVDGTSGPCGQPTFSDAETPGRNRGRDE